MSNPRQTEGEFEPSPVISAKWPFAYINVVNPEYLSRFRFFSRPVLRSPTRILSRERVEGPGTPGTLKQEEHLPRSGVLA